METGAPWEWSLAVLAILFFFLLCDERIFKDFILHQKSSCLKRRQRKVAGSVLGSVQKEGGETQTLT